MARCDALGVAPYSDSATGLTRAYLTAAHRAALDALSGWMGEAGMVVRLDPMGNLIGDYPGERADAPVLVIGSHIDSVADAGRYDGPLGIMLGIECVATLAAQGRRLPFAIKLVAFGDEEGSRFPAAMLTSRAVAGVLDIADLNIADGAGVTLAQAMADFGLDVTHADEARLTPAPLAYFEAHIEQGPVLEAEGLAVGTVTGIAAQSRYEVVVMGKAAHAGTTPMHLRGDAMAGAAEMVLAIEAVASGRADLVAFGRAFIANPDLVERLRDNTALNSMMDAATVYGGGAHGYIDYPTLEQTGELVTPLETVTG